MRNDPVDNKTSSPTEIAAGSPPVVAGLSEPAPHEPRDIRKADPGAREVFVAWEKLRLLYNAVLTAVVFWQMGLAAGDFLVNLTEAALIANCCFCAGAVAEGYLCWCRVNRVAARFVVFGAGTLLALCYTVEVTHRLINRLPVWPQF